ncbi:hypothetical protein ACFWDG_26850 [Peribacillus sp. NPDC060186]
MATAVSIFTDYFILMMVTLLMIFCLLLKVLARPDEHSIKESNFKGY